MEIRLGENNQEEEEEGLKVQKSDDGANND